MVGVQKIIACVKGDEEEPDSITVPSEKVFNILFRGIVRSRMRKQSRMKSSKILIPIKRCFMNKYNRSETEGLLFVLKSHFFMQLILSF